MARPRIYADDAAKLRAYRARRGGRPAGTTRHKPAIPKAADPQHAQPATTSLAPAPVPAISAPESAGAGPCEAGGAGKSNADGGGGDTPSPAAEISKVDSATVEGLVKAFLLPRYSDPKPVPEFHRDLWDLCCSDHRYVAIAAPRGFAKSTAVTHAYVLSRVLFRASKYVLIVSDTEGQASQFVTELKTELVENEELREAFGVKRIIKDTESDVIVRMDDGWQFRVTGKGSEQKVRGLKWNGGRPDLIVGDDTENDEIVMNPDRREKFRNWVYKALLPVGGDECQYRFVGTVLHFDSLLERFLNDETWLTGRFSAHADYDDFSDLLWPEKFPESRLREARAKCEAQGIPEAYAQEYLNVPMVEQSSFFKKTDFLPMTMEDRKKRKRYYALADLAISKSEKADYSAFGVVGMDDEGVIHVLDASKARMDSWEITEKVFELQRLWSPELFGIEEEKIKKALGPFWNREMIKRGVFINLPDPPLIPTKDKRARASAIQARMRAGGVRFDMEADWFGSLQQELLRFPRGGHDDYVDMLAWAGLLMDRLQDAPTDSDIEDGRYDRMREDSYEGRSVICGY